MTDKKIPVRVTTGVRSDTPKAGVHKVTNSAKPRPATTLQTKTTPKPKR